MESKGIRYGECTHGNNMANCLECNPQKVKAVDLIKSWENDDFDWKAYSEILKAENNVLAQNLSKQQKEVEKLEVQLSNQKYKSCVISDDSEVNKILHNKYKQLKEEIIQYIEQLEIPIPIERFFDDEGNHITKKEYGWILIEIMCKILRKKTF